MYQFIATYYNREAEEIADVQHLIEIDTIGTNMNERSAYITAMVRAYDKLKDMGEAWGLGSVEFLSC